VDLIEQFLARYTKEYDFYSQVSSIVRQKLEADLQAAGVRSIVTERAKSKASLENKCRKRETERGGYGSMTAIYDDIADLAGVRVALYYPSEIDQVDGAVTRLFNVILKKEFPDATKARPGKPRFSGYSATHYRVQLREEDLSEAEKRYAVARIEVQVASVLMHAWSEVEHDLVYKPLEGELSDEEYAILDQVNGLVMTGESLLESLRKANEARIAASGKKIANHYDLASLLLNAADGLSDKPISDAGLGKVDLLFDFIRDLKIDTPGSLKPYIEALHGNVEMRPLAEQVIDALLAADPGRYKRYDSVRSQRSWMSPKTSSGDEVHLHIGMFMKNWMDVEALLRQTIQSEHGRGPVIPSARELVNRELLTPDQTSDWERLRRTRNLLVHGVDLPELGELDEATNRLGAILSDIRHRIGDNGASASAV
jgi:ppGpp synthetase/RelA/SpoT-type nucleotidyltranferase